MDLTMAAGVIFSSLGSWWAWRAFRARARRVALLRRTVRARGRVVRVEDTTSEGDSFSTRTPVVAYAGADGRPHEIKLDPQIEEQKFRVGIAVPIYHERGAPENAVAVRRMWDVNLACVLSLLVVLIGAGFLFTVYQNAAAR